MTNNKQQTAVDILCGKLAMKLGIPQAITFYIDHQEEIREAKEMEKEQRSINLPSYEDIWKWWKTQKFQKEQGEQEYTMLYEIDLPKILKAFIEHFNKIQGGEQ
jgi:hypothetical protein